MSAELYDVVVAHQRRQTNPWIETHSGHRLDLGNPEESKIELVDIAHGLANTGRYAGQCSTFYSVAEHSVLVSLLLEQTGESIEIVQAGHMHDSPEAYIGDMTSPLKTLCPGYTIVEYKFELAIRSVFGQSVSFSNEKVKRADFEMFCREKAQLLSPWDSRPAERFGPELEIRCLPPNEAKVLFLNRAEELGIRG
jgi:hypothetical protein